MDPLDSPYSLAPHPAAEERQWLDEDHFLEPLEPVAPGEVGDQDPVVVDVSGRMWRLRRRERWARVLLSAGILLMVVVLLVGLLTLPL